MRGVVAQPGLCGEGEFAPFAGIHRSERTAEFRAAAQSHFDEGDDAAIEHHQVEFAEGITRVARQQLQPVRAQQLQRGVFGRIAGDATVTGQTRAPRRRADGQR